MGFDNADKMLTLKRRSMNNVNAAYSPPTTALKKNSRLLDHRATPSPRTPTGGRNIENKPSLVITRRCHQSSHFGNSSQSLESQASETSDQVTLPNEREQGNSIALETSTTSETRAIHIKRVARIRCETKENARLLPAATSAHYSQEQTSSPRPISLQAFLEQRSLVQGTKEPTTNPKSLDSGAAERNDVILENYDQVALSPSSIKDVSSETCSTSSSHGSESVRLQRNIMLCRYNSSAHSVGSSGDDSTVMDQQAAIMAFTRRQPRPTQRGRSSHSSNKSLQTRRPTIT
ncbi:hypothetical protein MPSEU_000039600 [Mayamaea pseudoterrestris]|nr:hypothetical protein MPSEU_000039600 [Mayamaea pseudoterrestris]